MFKIEPKGPSTVNGMVIWDEQVNKKRNGQTGRMKTGRQRIIEGKRTKKKGKLNHAGFGWEVKEAGI